MHFGNWNVTDDGIAWKAKGLNRFEIPKDDLNRIRHDKAANADFYEWILLATNEDWITHDDLYDLNYAFVYAAAKFNVDFNYAIFDATLDEQYDQLDAEEDDDTPF